MRWVLVIHVADYCLAESFGTQQLCAGNQLFELFFNFLLVVGAFFSFRCPNGFAEPREVEGQLLVRDGICDTLDDQVGSFFPTQITQHHFGRENK